MVQQVYGRIKVLKRKEERQICFKKKKIVKLLVIGLFFIRGQSVFASMEDISVNSKPVANQISQNTYYDLRMTPNQTQTLEIELISRSNQDETIDLEVTNATTNEIGQIDYSQSAKNKMLRDSSLELSLAEIVTIPTKVIVKAGSTTILPVTIQMPHTPYKGYLMGAIRLSSNTSKSDESVHNDFVYTIGIMLTEQDKPQYEKPKLDIVTIKPGHKQESNVIKVNLQNKSAIPIDEISYAITVKKRDEERVINKYALKDYRFAPNSNFFLNVELGPKKIKQGDYLLELKAESNNPKEEWFFQEEFAITELEAERMNEKIKTANPFRVALGGLLVTVVLCGGGSIFYYIRAKNRRRSLKE